MSYEQAHGYCATCCRHALFQRPSINHVLHLLISVFLLGVWLPVWLLISIARPGWRCVFCATDGRAARTPRPPATYQFARAGAPARPSTRRVGPPALSPTVAICAIFATLICGVFLGASRLANRQASTSPVGGGVAKAAAAPRTPEEREAGPKPVNGAWNGSVWEVDQELRRRLKDPDSLLYIDWYEPRLVALGGTIKAWAVRVTYRARNSFGGYMVETRNALVRNGIVVEFLSDEELDAMIAYRPPAGYPAGRDGVVPTSRASRRRTSAEAEGARGHAERAAGAPSARSGEAAVSGTRPNGADPCPPAQPTGAGLTSIPAAPAGASVGALMAEAERELARYADVERRRRKACDLLRLGRVVDWRQYTVEQLGGMEREILAARSQGP
jgi:hypothetical protein